MEGKKATGSEMPVETDKSELERTNAINAPEKSLQGIFHSMTKVWRKQINHVQEQLVSCTEISSLQNDCLVLEKCMKDLTMAHEELDNILESPVERIALFGKFEDMSKETNRVIEQVYRAIRDIKLDAEDNHSTISRRSGKSHASHRSDRSHSSRSSRSSTTSSTRQRRQELEENAAALKARRRVGQEKEKSNQANQLVLEGIKVKLQDIKNEESRNKFFFLMKDSKLRKSLPKPRLELRSAQNLRVKKNRSEPLTKFPVRVHTTVSSIMSNLNQYKLRHL